jgi:hypothetical protein
MKTTQVTQTAPPVERYVNRATGALLPDMAQVARDAEARLPQHQKDERLIDRDTLDTLEPVLKSMDAIIADREHTVHKLEPDVEAAEKKLERCREDVVNTTEAVAERVTGAKLDHKYALANLVDAQEALAQLKVRLEVAQRVLAATVAIKKEWMKLHGTRLAHLRKLSTRRKIGDKF